MNRSAFILTALALVAAATPAQAEVASYSGSYLFGSPIDFFFIDACGEPALEGVSSNCVALDEDFSGMSASLSITDAAGGADVADAAICWYAGGSFLACDSTTVAEGADSLSVSSLGGIAVSWTVSIG